MTENRDIPADLQALYYNALQKGADGAWIRAAIERLAAERQGAGESQPPGGEGLW